MASMKELLLKKGLTIYAIQPSSLHRWIFLEASEDDTITTGVFLMSLPDCLILPRSSIPSILGIRMSRSRMDILTILHAST